MKSALTATVLAVFGLAPAIGAACEYIDDSSASAAPPAQWGLAAPPAASKAPVVAKAVTPNAAKKTVAKVKAPVPDQKLAAGATN